MSSTDRGAVAALAEHLKAAAEAYIKANGLPLSFADIMSTYGETEMSVKVKLRTTATEDLSAQWARNCRFFNLKPEDYGRIVEIAGSRYKLLRIDLGKAKYPIIAEKVGTGSNFKLPADSVERACGRIRAAA